jgi:hypothetical protein
MIVPFRVSGRFRMVFVGSSFASFHGGKKPPKVWCSPTLRDRDRDRDRFRIGVGDET